MKRILIVLILSSFTFGAFANRSENRQTCFNKASNEVKKATLLTNNYDENGISTISCTLHSGRNIVSCDVVANKGDNSTNESFFVILNKACNDVLKIEQNGEE